MNLDGNKKISQRCFLFNLREWYVVFMNCLQENYLEDALKMHNLLEEFNENHGVCQLMILGVHEHIFTRR
jgi:hypothetical protein